MGSFAVTAKSLISKTVAAPQTQKLNTEEKLDHIKLLCDSGFSPRDIFRDLRELYDECETDEKGIKLQIGKLMIQVHGMLNSEDQVRSAPSFTIVVQGDNTRVNSMLCPGYAPSI